MWRVAHGRSADARGAAAPDSPLTAYLSNETHTPPLLRIEWSHDYPCHVAWRTKPVRVHPRRGGAPQARRLTS